MSVFKLMRVVFLLSILFVILASTWMTEKQMAAWERPILVTIYPIVADDEKATRRFVEEIDADDFREVNDFFGRASPPYGFAVTPAFRFQLAPVSAETPPPVPQQFNTAAIAWWSLKMRWWAWMRELQDGEITADIQMFVLFHSLNGNNEVGISVGMRKGRYGIVRTSWCSPTKCCTCSAPQTSTCFRPASPSTRTASPTPNNGRCSRRAAPKSWAGAFR